MRNLFLLITVSIICGCITNNKNKAPDIPVVNINGEELYKNNCASCHRCLVDFTGPALKGSISRWENKRLMYEFIRNPLAVIQKNEYAKLLQKKFGSIMPSSTLSDQELDAIFYSCDGYADSTIQK